MEGNYILYTYPHPAPLTTLPIIPFTTEEITACTNEVDKGLTKLQEIHFLVFLFHVLMFE